MDPVAYLLEWLPLIFIVAVVLALLSRIAGPSPRFIRKRFLTEAETRVLGFLEAALPQHRVMAQVAMGSLLKAGETNRRRALATRNRFSGKIVDFAIVTRDTAEIIALVELDDSSHSLLKDAKRDAMTAAAGYQTIRIAGRPRPSLQSVREAVAVLATPSRTESRSARTSSDMLHIETAAGLAGLVAD